MEFRKGISHRKLSLCRSHIYRWKKSTITNSAKLIEEIKDQLDLAQDDNNYTLEDVEDIRRKLLAAFRDEEKYWHQKSRVIWRCKGDMNTSFFHATTKQRRARNRIISLKDHNGHLVEDARGVEKLATNYFGSLYTTSSPQDL